MKVVQDTKTEVIPEILTRHVSQIRANGRECWSFSVGGRQRLKVVARLRGEWLLFDAPFGFRRSRKGLSHQALSELIAINGQLRGGVKFGLRGQPPQIHLSAEIPLDEECVYDDQDFESHIVETLAGFKDGLKRWKTLGQDSGTAVLPQQFPPDTNERLRIESLLEEMDWPFVERADGQVAVQLNTDAQFAQALLQQDADGSLRIRAQLRPITAVGEVSRYASVVFLLLASRTVRMARAMLTTGSEAAYSWEACLDDCPTLSRLIHALSSRR